MRQSYQTKSSSQNTKTYFWDLTVQSWHWPLEGQFSSPGPPPPPRSHVRISSSISLTLPNAGVCGGEFSLPICGVAWPTTITLTQLFHFTKGKLRLRGHFWIVFYCVETWCGIFKHLKSFILGKIKPLLQRREAKIRSSETARGIPDLCCVFGIHQATGPLLSLGRNQTRYLKDLTALRA